MILKTKYDENQKVWVINPKSGAAVQRTIFSIRTQSIHGKQKTIYAFVKDWCENPMPELTDCFWLSEEKIFTTKEELKNSF